MEQPACLPEDIPNLSTNPQSQTHSLTCFLIPGLDSNPRVLTSGLEDGAWILLSPNPTPSLCFQASVPRDIANKHSRLGTMATPKVSVWHRRETLSFGAFLNPQTVRDPQGFLRPPSPQMAHTTKKSRV